MRAAPTPAEARLWASIRGRQLEGWKFRRQHVIAGFIVDFYCPEIALAVEVDGLVHRDRRAVDRARDRALTSLGVLVVRLTNEMVANDLDGSLRFITVVARSRLPGFADRAEAPAD